jgi:hypothetical protein
LNLPPPPSLIDFFFISYLLSEDSVITVSVLPVLGDVERFEVYLAHILCTLPLELLLITLRLGKQHQCTPIKES